MRKTFHSYADPGHGWLAVRKDELQTLGIANQISPCSYERGDMAYLEEDCDATLFFAALKETNVEPKIISHATDRSSKIRSYDGYLCTATPLGEVEKIASGRWLIRDAQGNRAGEVMGGNGVYQAQTMKGAFVGNAGTLYSAANMLTRSN